MVNKKKRATVQVMRYKTWTSLPQPRSECCPSTGRAQLHIEMSEIIAWQPSWNWELNFPQFSHNCSSTTNIPQFKSRDKWIPRNFKIRFGLYCHCRGTSWSRNFWASASSSPLRHPLSNWAGPLCSVKCKMQRKNPFLSDFHSRTTTDHSPVMMCCALERKSTGNGWRFKSWASLIPRAAL